jgi:hypothetical protein
VLARRVCGLVVVRPQYHSLLNVISYFTECLKLTKAVQKTADTLQTVANLYEGHVRQAFRLFSLKFGKLNFVLSQKARRTQLATHESLKLLAHPAAMYEVNLFSFLLTLSLSAHLCFDFFG